LAAEYDDRKFNFYYRDPSIAAAAAIVEAYLARLPDLHAAALAGDKAAHAKAFQWISSHTAFFVHVAAGRPEIVRMYERYVRDHFDDASMLLPILRDVGDEQTDALLRELQARERGFADKIDALLRSPRGSNSADAVRAPITEVPQLDHRWAHFFATGEARPILELLELLTWPDGVRAHLATVLRPHSGLWASLTGRRARQVRALRELEALGLRFDPHTGAALNRDDLDRFVMMSGCRMNVERFKAVHAALPVPIPLEPLTRASMKSSAMWSLATNATEHPLVLELCEQAAGRFEGAAQLGVLAILGHAYEQRDDFAAARRVVAQHRAQDPERDDLRESLSRIALAEEFAALRTLEPRPVEALAPDQVAAALARCVARFRSPPAYHARLEHRIGGPNKTCLHFRARFAGRDREHVLLSRVGGEMDGLADEWIRVGSRRWVNPGLWVMLPADWHDKVVTPPLLRVDPYVEMLAAASPRRAVVVAGAPYLRVDLEIATLPGVSEQWPGPFAVEVWIDVRDGWLAHAHVRPAGGGADELHASFVVADPQFTIEAPADAIEGG